MTDVKCPKCGFEFDTNEDFTCMHCGRPVPGRYLFCGNQCQERYEFNQNNLFDARSEIEQLKREALRLAQK